MRQKPVYLPNPPIAGPIAFFLWVVWIIAHYIF